MPSNKHKRQTTHEPVCSQEDRIVKMEGCLIRIDERLKVLDKLDGKVDQLLNGGGASPGLTNRVTKLETRQGVIWFVLFISLATAIGVFIKEVWPKAS